MSIRLWLRDNTNGSVHEYGTNQHDALVVTDNGTIHYENLQNGCGTMFPEEGYSFCRPNGEALIDELAITEEPWAYADIGAQYWGAPLQSPEQTKRIRDILTLIAEHPELPILPIVDGQIVADDCCSYWSGSWGRAEIKKVCIARERSVFWEDEDLDSTFEDCGFDYEECGITDDTSRGEDEAIMVKRLEMLDWLTCIVIYIELPDDIIPDNDARIAELRKIGNR